MNNYEKRAEMLKAMAHPVRIKIIEALAQGEKCVCELQKLSKFKMSTISRHLLQMKNAKIIAGRRDKNQIFYKLLVPCVLNVFKCIDNAMCSNKRSVC